MFCGLAGLLIADWKDDLNQQPWMKWVTIILMLVVGIGLIVNGAIGIKKKRIQAVNKKKYGKRVYEGTAAVWVGIGQCAAGGILVVVGIIVAIIGPFLADDKDKNGGRVNAPPPAGFGEPRPRPGPNPFPFGPNPPQPAPKPPVSGDPITLALHDLKVNDLFKKRGAAQQLQVMAPDDRRRGEVVQALEAALGDSDGATRAFAVRALVPWAGKDVSPKLVPLVNDKDREPRHAAIQALAQWKYEPAADAIAERLTDLRDRGTASAALIDIGPGAEKAVTKMLQGSDRLVVREVCKVLGMIGTRASIPALQAVADGPDLLAKRFAEDAIKTINRRP